MVISRHKKGSAKPTPQPRADLVGKYEGALGVIAWIRRDPAY